MKFSIPTPSDFSFSETLSAHGWRRLLPFVWDEDVQTLTRSEELGNGQVIQVEMSAGPGEVVVVTDADCNQAELTRRISRMLQLDLPLDEFHAYCLLHPKMAPLIESKRGRMLRSPTLFEDTLKVIATSNTTWAQTIAMSARLVREFGTEDRTFPTAYQIASVSFDEFAAKARMGYRNQFVHSLATSITDGKLNLEDWQSEPMTALEMRKRLLALPGIGPYGAACLMLYLGRPEHVNSDSVARALLSGELGRPVTDKEVLAFFEAHGKWRGLVYNFYPWKQDRYEPALL